MMKNQGRSARRGLTRTTLAVAAAVVSVASTSSAIIGGAATSARPEVGLWSNDITWCGATMITDQYAVSAANCNYGLPTTIKDSTFQGIAVDHVWIFGAGPAVESDPGNFNQDVMLMKLASPVTGVTPATISTRWANMGETVTIMGYGPAGTGCTGSGGSKHYLTFPLDTTNHICDGDGGGPMFLGDLASNGALVAVNSSQNQPKEGYGDAVMFREDIASIMRLWDGGLEQGINRGGWDLPGMPVTTTSAADCKTQCEANSSCVAFTWLNNQCWEKNGIPAWSLNSACTSGVVQQATEKLETDTGRPGGDFYNFTGTVQACRDACAKDARCKAFTQYNGTCWLKSYVPAPIHNTGATSGVRAAPQYKASRSATSSNTIKTVLLDAQLPQACAAQCASTSGCVSYNWRRPLIALKAKCTLLNNNPTPASAEFQFATQDVARSFY